MALPDEAKQMGAPPHWLGYVGTPDVAATAKQAAGLGGKVLVQPQEIPTVGTFAVLQDPQGAVLAAFAPAQGPMDLMGQVAWHELLTTDYEAAFDFYNALFGWNKTEAMDMGEMGVYQMYGLGDVTLGGMMNKTADMNMPGPPSWLHYMTVPSADAAAEKVAALGGKVGHGPMDVPGGGRIAQCFDPQGAAFAVHSTASGS